MKWLIIKFNDTLGIDTEDGCMLHEYEILGRCKTEKQAYKEMHIKAKELNLYGMKYKHLEKVV